MEENEDTRVGARSSSEKRKLRSRDAARCRRSQETEVFYEVAQALPLPRRVSANLDKAGIMRVALSFLRLRRLLRHGEEEKEEEEQEEQEEEEEDPMAVFYPQALSGFVLLMSEEGDVIYLTENVSKHIGLTQLELLGQSIYDFIHPCDQEEVRELLTAPRGFTKKSSSESSERNFFLRMKSTLTSRGRTVNIKSAAWKVFHCTGHLRPVAVSPSPPAGRVMALLCEPLPHPSSVDFPLDSHTFITRHSLDLRFTHCEGRVTELVGYKPDDLIGRSAYEFHHALDSDHVNKSLHTLLTKGQVSTSCYRFLVNRGGFVWAETQATVLVSSRNQKPEAVVCLNHVLSAVEQSDVVFSMEQTRCSSPPQSKAKSLPIVTQMDCRRLKEEEEKKEKEKREEKEEEEEKKEESSPVSASDLFFKLKEKPEELLQLAPEAGDIVPLSTEFAELSFSYPSDPNSVPEQPQLLCSPKLLQILLPIFNPLTPPPTPPSSSSPRSSSPPADSSPEQSCSDEDDEADEEEEMDMSMVEKFFAVCPDKSQSEGEILECEDLDSLAPYISMDDDFLLTSLSVSPEETTPSKTTTVTTTLGGGGGGSRKRVHHLNQDQDQDQDLAQLVIRDKRQKQDLSSIEDLILSHGLLDCLEETGLSDSVLDPGSGSGVQGRLLTDRDPLLGGVQGLYDTAALMRDIFIPPPLPPPHT